MYYTYVLASLKDGEWYTGAASDLKARLSQHERGEVSSTRFRRPLQLTYYEACREVADAYRRERYLKTGRGKRYLRQRLKTWRMQFSLGRFRVPDFGATFASRVLGTAREKLERH